MPILEIENRAGEPIQTRAGKITLFSQVVRLNFPHRAGGLIWNHPAAVLVQANDGSEQVLPVQDTTRQIQLVIFGGALAVILLSWLITCRRKI